MNKFEKVLCGILIGLSFPAFIYLKKIENEKEANLNEKKKTIEDKDSSLGCLWWVVILIVLYLIFCK